MLQYGWRILKTRGSVWILAVGCAFLAGIPGVLAGTVLAAPVVAFVVTGDPFLAFNLLPASLTGSIGPAVGAWVAIGIAALICLCIWSRLYAAAVWGSDQDNDTGLRAALAATGSRWRSVVKLYIESGALLVCVLVPVVSFAFASGTGPSGGLLLLALVAALAARALIRVTTTLAIRACVLDSVSSRAAWRFAIGVLQQRRTDAGAVWVALLAIGAATWLGGRLISPILQDTAFDYPSLSSYAVIRELAQILFAVPLETFLLVFSMGAWTAVYRGIDVRSEPKTERRPADPWVARAAAGLLVLTLIANGVPTFVDSRYADAQAQAIEAIGSREIEAEETLRPAPTASPRGTSYDVRATLEDEDLSWDTAIGYRNETGGPLRSIVLNLYPLAYQRPLEQIPLADDLLAADLSGAFRAEAEPGTLNVERVLIDDVEADTSINDTSMLVRLPRPLEDGAAVDIRIALSSDLPTFPERFGVWKGITLLGNWVPTVAVRSDGVWLRDRFGAVGDPFVSEVADYRVAIEADDRQSVVGSGSLVSIEQTTEDTRTWTFEAPGLRDVAFAISSSFRVQQELIRGIVVRSWYPASARALGADNLKVAASALSDYTDRFGNLPFDEVEVVATTGLLGGMEYPGVVFVSQGVNSLEGVPILPELLEFAGFEEAQRHYVLGHELAHQWWYASVGNDQVREPWLDEALAEVSTITWLRRTEGDDRTWRMTNLLSNPPPSDRDLFASIDAFDSNQEYTESVYQSGAEVLLDLRAAVGAGSFDAILHTYHDDNQSTIATRADFIDAIEDVAGTDAMESFGP